MENSSIVQVQQLQMLYLQVCYLMYSLWRHISVRNIKVRPHCSYLCMLICVLKFINNKIKLPNDTVFMSLQFVVSRAFIIYLCVDCRRWLRWQRNICRSLQKVLIVRSFMFMSAMVSSLWGNIQHSLMSLLPIHPILLVVKYAMIIQLEYMVFSRPYLGRSHFCYSVASVVVVWRYVLWLNGAS